LVLWDFDSGDSVGSTVEQSEAAYATLANSGAASILALNHDVYGQFSKLVFEGHHLQPC
jgi:hypothetical protein